MSQSALITVSCFCLFSTQALTREQRLMQSLVHFVLWKVVNSCSCSSPNSWSWGDFEKIWLLWLIIHLGKPFQFDLSGLHQARFSFYFALLWLLIFSYTLQSIPMFPTIYYLTTLYSKPEEESICPNAVGCPSGPMWSDFAVHKPA